MDRSNLRRGTITRLLAIMMSLALVAACGVGTPASVGPSVGASSGPSAAPSEAPALGGTLRQRIFGDWTTFDPWEPGTTNSNQIMAAVYDRLVLVHEGKVIPYIASSWEQTPTSLTFHLRDDATCADGSPVTPSLVARNWDRLLDPDNPSQNAGQFLGKGPYSWEADDADGTVTLMLNQPRGDAIYAFTGSFGSIVCPPGLDDPASLATTPSGSGPFVLESAVLGDGVRLTARPDWTWGPNGASTKAAGFPQELIYRVVTNETTASNLLVTGDLDLGIVKGPDVARLRADASLVSRQALPYTADPMQFNEDPSRVTADQAVRRALSTAVDPAGWNQAMNNGEGVLSSSVVTPNAPCFDPGTAGLMPTPDTDAARQILLDAGWVADGSGKLSKDGTPLAIHLLGNATQGSGPEYVLEQFTAIGATVTMEQLPFSDFAVKYRGSDFDVTVGNLSFSVPGPMQTVAYLSGPLPPDGRNFGRIVDPVLLQAVNDAQATTGDEQCRHWATVQRRYLEMNHVLPLAGQVTSVFARSGFDFFPTANNFIEPHALRAPAN